jgi:hypothetical protein
MQEAGKFTTGVPDSLLHFVGDSTLIKLIAYVGPGVAATKAQRSHPPAARRNVVGLPRATVRPMPKQRVDPAALLPDNLDLPELVQERTRH